MIDENGGKICEFCLVYLFLEHGIYLHAIKVEEGQKESAAFIDTSEILFFGVEDNKLVVHTRTERFYLPTSLEYCSLLNQFERVERGFVANMEHISVFDSDLQLLHFKDSSKTCYVSQNHKNRLKLK